jgi:hypothetical protein
LALERFLGATGFMFRIKMQHDSRDFAPVSTLRIRVEQAQIRGEVSSAPGARATRPD